MVVSSVLVVGFLVYIAVAWNGHTLEMLNYPVDSYGHSCYVDYRNTYPFLYMDFSAAVVKYRCVNQCPAVGNGYTVMDSRGSMILVPAGN
jgi:hypothetical protein